MKYKNIACFGGHHLDAELMGGPLMIKYAQQGSTCTYINMTEGRLENPSATNKEKEDYLTKIRSENIAADTAMLGKTWNMGHTSQSLPNHQEMVEVIEEYLEKNQIDLVITHWRGTLHPRHYYTYQTVTQAVKNIRKTRQIQLLYGENCEDLVGFIPTCYVGLNPDHIQIWLNGLKKYSIFNGAVNNVPYEAYYTTQLKIRAMEVGSNQPVKAYMHGGLLDNE